MSPDGSKVVVWEDDNNNNRFYQIYAAVYDGNGARKKPVDIVVNGDDTGQQRRPDVAMDSQGNFVVVWQDDRTGFNEIRAARFTAGGDKIGSDFTISDAATGLHVEPRIAMRQLPGTGPGRRIRRRVGGPHRSGESGATGSHGPEPSGAGRIGPAPATERSISSPSAGRGFRSWRCTTAAATSSSSGTTNAGEAGVPDVKMAGFGANGSQEAVRRVNVQEVTVNTTTNR